MSETATRVRSEELLNVGREMNFQLRGGEGMREARESVSDKEIDFDRGVKIEEDGEERRTRLRGEEVVEKECIVEIGDELKEHSNEQGERVGARELKRDVRNEGGRGAEGEELHVFPNEGQHVVRDVVGTDELAWMIREREGRGRSGEERRGAGRG